MPAFDYRPRASDDPCAVPHSCDPSEPQSTTSPPSSPNIQYAFFGLGIVLVFLAIFIVWWCIYRFALPFSLLISDVLTPSPQTTASPPHNSLLSNRTPVIIRKKIKEGYSSVSRHWVSDWTQEPRPPHYSSQGGHSPITKYPRRHQMGPNQ